jgi:hypothetical protein
MIKLIAALKMPPKKPVEHRSKGATENNLLLQYGPTNNIISWRDRMEEECVELYGMTGTFFSTDKAYVIPYPIERDFHPFPEMLEDEESESDDGEFSDAVGPDPSAVVNGEGDTAGNTVEDIAEDMPAPATEVDKATKSLIAKMRENAYEARRKKIEVQELNLTKLWPFVTSQISSAKVREFPGYEYAKASRDFIKLWRFIRRSHLTHVYGQSDHLRAVNINDQLIRFGNLRQGQHEPISDFKTKSKPTKA